jgi:triacylglycerol lipase
MNFDNGWDALLNPGNATTYFEGHQQREFNPGAEGYNRANAWWLAEMCRLVYKQGKDEPRPSEGDLTRQAVLDGLGLSEDFVQHDLAQCALVKPREGSSHRIVVFRGSHDLRDWLTNFEVEPADCSTGGKAHKGFLTALDSVWERLSELLGDDDSPVFFTGHSLGGALATLAAALYKRPCQLYTFGSPLVGDEDFSAALRNVASYRIVNNRDIVATVPPAVPPCDSFRHIPKLHYITHKGEILDEPSPEAVAEDRMKRDHFNFLEKNWKEHFDFRGAPEPLADHSPVNYVAHLEKAL